LKRRKRRIEESEDSEESKHARRYGASKPDVTSLRNGLDASHFAIGCRTSVVEHRLSNIPRRSSCITDRASSNARRTSRIA
jgi:hypothetical protein